MQDNSFISIGLPISLFIIMFGMGLSLQLLDFRRVLEQPVSVAIGSVLQLLVIPAVGFLIAAVFGNDVFAVGIVLIAVLPGGTTSNVFCYLAKSNLALSITLTLIASLTSIFCIPLYLNLALNLFVGGNQDLSLPVISTLITMLVIIVIPVGLGMLVKAYQTNFALAVEKFTGFFAIFVLIAIIVAIVILERDNLSEWILSAWLPVLALNLLALASSYMVARISRLSMADTLTLMIESGLKNTALGLTIALSLLNSVEIALPAAVYGLLMYASAIGLAAFGRRYATTVAAPQ